MNELSLNSKSSETGTTGRRFPNLIISTLGFMLVRLGIFSIVQNCYSVQAIYKSIR